jgi:tetratricopeptide (TPR) repeat protein
MGGTRHECVDEETALSFLGGRLSAIEVQRIEEHADRCSACRTFLSTLAELASQPPVVVDAISPLAATDFGETPSPIASVPLFTRGDVLARYVVLSQVGVGGMGVVYAAYDPELDRKVALKLLRKPREGHEVARARLLREAQALARLTHPNVVAVYDAGAWQEQLFLAMEFIEGGTVRDWLTAAARSWREVLDTYLAAGRGLEAAHARGLVHRDFKPDNLLVGKDGRVLVTDFGLARAVGQLDSVERSPSPPMLDSPLTATGAVLGTPGYMAPEQKQGHVTDARSDQYSFCVALHEGLYGAVPGQPLPDPRRDVPAWIGEILTRGLAEDPDRRYPSMEALLGELAIDPRKRRLRRLSLAGLGLMLAAAVALPVVTSRRQSQLCSGGADQFAEVWSPSRRAQVQGAILATHVSWAGDAAKTVDETLERYRRDWVAMYTDACRATRVRGEQTDEALGLRMECLSSRLGEVGATVDELSRTNDKRVKRVIQAALGISPLAECADLKALAAPVRPPSDPPTRAKVTETRKRLQLVRALFATGDFAEAKKQALSLAEQVRAIDYAPLSAEVLYQLGGVQARLEELPEAQSTFQDAALAAEAGGHDEVAAASWVKTVTVAADQRRFEDGHRVARQAEAAVRRLRGRHPDIEVQLYRYSSDLWRAEGQYDAATRDGRRAVELAESRLGPESLETSYSLGNLANVLDGAGHVAEALEYERRAAKIAFALFPEGHPQRDYFHQNLGVDLYNLGRFDEAREHFEAMVKAVEARGDKDSYDLAWPLGSLGEYAEEKGDHARAMELFQRVLAIREKVNGADHPDNAMELRRISGVLLATGKPQPALETAMKAVGLLDAQKLTTPLLTAALAQAADAQLALHAPKKALPLAERAVQVGQANHHVEDDRLSPQVIYALTLWENGQHQAARQLALETQTALSKHQPLLHRDLERINAWLTTHL